MKQIKSTIFLLAATFSSNTPSSNAFLSNRISTTKQFNCLGYRPNVSTAFLAVHNKNDVRFQPLYSSEEDSTSTSMPNLLSLTLEKPLGLILEEVEEGSPMGVKVEELSDGGSAYTSEYKDRLVGLKISQVMGEDVTSITFDEVMQKIIDAPSPVSIDFEVDEEKEVAIPQFEVGTDVTITVIQEGKETVDVEGKVGDNLRKTLLANNVELYRGMKKKLGNCGGAGQCTFCAVDFVKSEGWAERSEYEDGKIGKWPSARLACQNAIQGPATIRIQ